MYVPSRTELELVLGITWWMCAPRQDNPPAKKTRKTTTKTSKTSTSRSKTAQKPEMYVVSVVSRWPLKPNPSLCSNTADVSNLG